MVARARARARAREREREACCEGEGAVSERDLVAGAYYSRPDLRVVVSALNAAAPLPECVCVHSG